MDCYILHTFLSVTILLFMITLFASIMQNIHQNKKYCRINKVRMENDELKKVSTKNCACYYFDDIIDIEDFDFGNILIK